MSRERRLAAAGTAGALLTSIIVAASVWLRLTAGAPDPEVETWLRIAHRVAAMGVGVLAAYALVLERSWAVGTVVACTVLLAVVGRYTPGYRFDVVTVVNVAGGLALASAFWWLRYDRREAPSRLALAALGALLLTAALGAASSAAASRGLQDYGPLHLGAADFTAVLAWAVAWRARQRRIAAISLAAISAGQVALGFYVLAAGAARPVAAAWLHAMVALALALLLVSLVFRR